MISVKQFNKPDGSTDWAAYKEAKKQSGDECYRCGHWILFAKGYRTLCHDCEQLGSSKEEVRASSGIRCPHCRWTSADPYEISDNIYEEGEHHVFCSRCEGEYTFETHVAYSWTSPKLIDRTVSDEAEENDDEFRDDEGASNAI